MLRVLLVLGLLVLVPAVLVFWRTRDRAGIHASPSNIVGTSTLSHGSPPPRPARHPGEAPSGSPPADGR
ncbi:hypothetical protein [Nitrospira moscoviensis]|uniref:Uncharacterized protein n=1 Tax=Nitrospira moscoviensis TaxID=42253 RepID=A0A0K2GC33_NITMO|nr:hypothetical protein [Nitrospira moscoviensis]ALA58508.1 exported protein of unknown function [Nitrospira moscoviensis]